MTIVSDTPDTTAVVVFIGAGEDYGPLPDGALVAFTREGFWGLPAHAELRTTHEGDDVRITVLLPVYSRNAFKLSGLEPSGQFLENLSFVVTCPTREARVNLYRQLQELGWEGDASPSDVSAHASGACQWVREALS